jgi:hypothetical protein
VPEVFATNGRQFVAFDRTGITSATQLLAAFPGPAELRAWYEAAL